MSNEACKINIVPKIIERKVMRRILCMHDLHERINYLKINRDFIPIAYFQGGRNLYAVLFKLCCMQNN